MEKEVKWRKGGGGGWVGLGGGGGWRGYVNEVK